MRQAAILNRTKEPRWFLTKDLDFILHCCGGADRLQFFDECRRAVQEGRAVHIGTENDGRRRVERSFYTMKDVAESEAEVINAILQTR